MNNKDDIKIGDIVTCSRSGWWRVKSQDAQGRINLELVLSRDGDIPKKFVRTHSSHKNWCKKITIEEVLHSKKTQNKILDTLTLIIDPKQIVDNEEVLKSFENKEKPEPEYLKRLGPPPSLIGR